MVFGTTTFKCTKCDSTFEGLDIEYNATIWRVPQRCPKCGSIRTYPRFALLDRWLVYPQIWKEMEKKNQ